MDPTQEAFEKTIDSNPLEATVHHAYADWLDESGQHDESRFRRSMANWVSGRKQLKPHERMSLPLEATAHHGELPEGVSNLPMHGRPITEFGESTRRPRGTPEHVATFSPTTKTLHWPSYRGMETAFRSSYMKNLTSKRLSRRVESLRRMRRGR